MLQLLRTVYPQACLIVEIVSVEEGNYLIRASVQVEGIAIANAFAVSSDLEVAQDRALQRLFKMLAIAPAPVGELELSQKKAIAPPISGSHPATPLNGTANSQDLDRISPKIEAVQLTQPNLKPLLEVPKSDLVEPPAGNDKLSKFNTQPSPPAKIVETAEPSPTVLSASMRSVPSPRTEELKQQIEVEMKRLAWTRKRGSEYLKQTYQKETRDKLTEEQLQEFCDYLQSLPSPVL